MDITGFSRSEVIAISTLAVTVIATIATVLLVSNRWVKSILFLLLGGIATFVLVMMGGQISQKEKTKDLATVKGHTPEQPKIGSGKDLEGVNPPSAISAPRIDKRRTRLDEFKTLLNRGIAAQIGKTNVAIVIDAKKTQSGLSPETTLYNHLKTDKVNVVSNLFKEESFKSEGFFREIYDGNTEILRQAGALSKINHLILGKLNYSFQRGGTIDKDLISCSINFSYKIFDRDAVVIKSDSISVVGPGFSEDAALERGLEILTEKYSERIFKPIV